jgi:hypothetical protein
MEARMKTAISCVLGLLCGFVLILVLRQDAEILSFNDPVGVFGWEWVTKDILLTVGSLVLSLAFFDAARTEYKMRRLPQNNLSATH